MIFSLFWSQSASAEIKVIPPPNWQPAPTNNSTKMGWTQNSTKSAFMIVKAPDNLVFPLFLVGPMIGQLLADKGILESADQTSFGHSNYGYRYILNVSSLWILLNSSGGLIQQNNLLPTKSQVHDFPFKIMLILTQKHNDIYAIIFGSPKHNFEIVQNEIKPTLDSIQFD